MGEGVVVEMMRPDFLLWRCLHCGPLTPDGIDHPQADPEVPVDWPGARARNLPILRKLTEAYGSCAVTASDGGKVIGMLRFYPKAVREMAGSMGFCMQQPFPCGPPADFAESVFPPVEALADRTLSVHCMTAGQPGDADDRYRHKGLGSSMVGALIDWARPHGWEAIEATSCVDLEVLYAVSGMAGRSFWEKLGFRVAETGVEPELQKDNDLVQAMRREASARGIPRERLADKYTMRFDLR